MDLGIAGRTALVAGGSAGLGLASARALAREGVRLTISARGEERLRAAQGDLTREFNTPVQAVVADHGSEAGRKALLEACPAPDIVVICCSPPRFTEDYREITPSDWEATLATTFIGPVELMRTVAPGMAARRFGRIVNIGTMAAKYPLALRMLSGPPRSAAVNYAVALAKRVARDNVIVNNLLPGIFHTPGLEETFATAARENGTTRDEEAARFARRWKIPAGTYGDPDDFGACCAFLCSRYVGFTLGQSLVVDGGLGAGLF